MINLPTLKTLVYGLLLIVTATSINVRSFSTVIETGSKNIVGGINTIISTTLSFTSTKTDTAYNYALSVQKIEINPKPSTRIYSYLMSILSISTSQMILSLSSSQSNTVKTVRIRYLIIQSSFTCYISTASFYNQYATPYQLNSATSFVESVGLTCAMATGTVVMGFVNSWEIEQSASKQMSLYAQPALSSSSSTTVDVTISNTIPSSDFCALKTIGFSVVAYNINYFKGTYNNQIFQNGQANAISASNPAVYTFALPINPNAYFVGHYGYYVNNADMDFTFSQNSANVRVQINNSPPSSSQILSFSYIQFQTIPICILPDVWNQANNQCQTCTLGYYYDSALPGCKMCSLDITYCLDCVDSVTCTFCDYSLTPIGNVCSPICNDINCVTCSFSIPNGIFCSSCASGYMTNSSNPTHCITICGDGIVIGSQTCDDANFQDGDGCSALCRIQDQFSCDTATGSPSQCFLLSLDVSVFCIIKNQGINAFTITLDLRPKNLRLYSYFNWALGFPSTSVTTLQEAKYDTQDSRLRIVFGYSSSIQDLTNLIPMSPSLISSLLNKIADKDLLLPQNTENNQAMIYYDQNHYTVAKAVKYLAYAITALVYLLFFLGYFGAKLIAIECIAVIQLSGMLLFSLKNMNPTMAALEPLSLSLGLVPLVKGYKYQISSLSPHFKYLFLTNGLLDGQNIFLILVLLPMLIALVIKLLSNYKYKDKPVLKFAWKNCLGTYTFYGILMLAYGQFSYLAVNAKQFFSQINSYITLSITAIFTVLVIAYIVGFYKYPRWFGSFKNKFEMFSISEYFYVLSTFQRMLTPILIVTLSPFKYASLVLCPIFVLEAIFIACKKPYTLDSWKRPFANKVFAVLICILFMCAAVFESQQTIQKVVPVVIETILLIMIGYSGYLAIKQYPKNYEQVKLKAENATKAMEFKDCQKKQIQDFAVKMLPPEYLLTEQLNKQNNAIEHSNFKWYWQNYSKLYSISILSNLNDSKINLLLKKEEDNGLKAVATKTSL